MKATSILSLSHAKQANLLLPFILALICVLSFSARLFSVLRYESVIHEYDPYFNYRSTVYLVKEGLYNFHNWFDSTSWYPLGRIVGGTVYPGLMWSAGLIYKVLHFLNFTVDIRNVCVLTAPTFSGLTAIATFLLTKEAMNASAGLVAAAFVGMVPGYISRSVAGSFDNEGIAIFALIFTYYLWNKAVNTGSLLWSCLAALAYFYMVSAWGGYVFIINLIPLHALALMLSGRFSHRLYVAYSTFYVLATLLSMQITFVGFQPVQSSEHMAALGVFGLLQLYCGRNWIKSILAPDQYNRVFRAAVILLASLLAVAMIAAQATGYVSPWTGRFYSLLDPSYAKAHIPIIASVSEHQPTTWASFFFDLHILVFLFPAGLYFCFQKINDTKVFLIVYGATSVYFAGVMVRLMLVLAPIACMLSAIAITSTLETYMRQLKRTQDSDRKTDAPIQKEISTIVVLGITVLLVFFAWHCTWVTSEAYSSPSIVLAARSGDGGRIIFDDFREAYSWLAHNTPENAKIMSWWDYGYQIAAMGKRTILVDNNTWNNTHISQVGKAFSSREEVAYPILQKLDVDYVLVIFGGMTGYSSDDINKFLWMVRIGGSTDPSIRESDYYTPQGEFRIDAAGSPQMLNCLMYKLCYYRFGEVYTEQNKPSGYDRVRSAEIGNKKFTLQYLDEAYTSEHWIVRIFKVKKQSNRS